MKKNTKKDYAIALYETAKDLKGKELHQAIQNLVHLLYRKHLLHHAERIIAEFVTYAKKQEGIQDIAVMSTHQLDTKTINEIKKIFGEKVEATQVIDKSLLGGFVVKTADKIFDASLKTQLHRLKYQLQ